MSTATADPIVENVPAEIRAIPHWCPWRFESKPGTKPKKMPKRWNRPGNAASNRPDEWTTFDNAMQSCKTKGYDGVAFMLSDDDPYTMFDLDHCVIDGEISNEALEVVKRFATYAEISISGAGLKGICRGKFDGKGKNVSGIGEIYCRGRMFCFTGDHLPGSPKTINENQAAVDWWYAKLVGRNGSSNVHPARSGTDVSGNDNDQDSLVERCWRYVNKCPDAISGQNGHGRTFHFACLCYKFGLDDDHAREVMQRVNAEKTGDEQWDNEELEHKLADARKEVESKGESGSMIHTGRRDDDDVLDKKNPLPIARRFIAENFYHPDHPTLILTDNEYFRSNAVCWEIIGREAIRQRLYHFVEPFKIVVHRGKERSLEPFKPQHRDIDSIADALRAVVYRPACSPCWLNPKKNDPDPSQLIVAPNGLFRWVGDAIVKIGDPTPRLFTTIALDYPFNPNAPAPRYWLNFLMDVFEDDQQQIELLQEWIGYLLTTDTSLQKMMLLIGPPRSGKGTMGRVISRVVGAGNVVAPTLATLGDRFGLSALVDKTLAIISDARMSNRTDQAVVTERLLSITGEDALTIDRKNRELVTRKLTTRIMVLTNELPRLSDSSGALASRFLILTLRKSYLGCEDVGLTDRLLTEVPGIAAWAIRGLIRLRSELRFTQPKAADELRDEISDLASPANAFIRDWCSVRPGLEVERAELFTAWAAWCDEQGNKHPGTLVVFGRDLRAAVPGLGTGQRRRDDGTRTRIYSGIDLTVLGRESASKWRSAHVGTCATITHARREGEDHVT